MNSDAKQEQLRNFRKEEPTTDNKKQSSMLRFVRREPSANSSINGSSPCSPKISTIVVRKPSSVVTFKSNSASTTAHAFNAFNSSKLYNIKAKVESSQKEESDMNEDTTNTILPGSSSSSSSPVMDQSNSGSGTSQMLFIDSPGSSYFNGESDLSQNSPIIRVKIMKKKNRVLESDDESDSESAAPPAKRAKTETENVLCKDFTEEPTHLIDNYLSTLEALYPTYEKMELQDILRSWSYNFSEVSCYLEKEEVKRKEAQVKQTRLDRMERLRLQVAQKTERVRQSQLQVDESRKDSEEREMRAEEEREEKEDRAKDSLKAVQERQRERDELSLKKHQEKLERLEQQDRSRQERMEQHDRVRLDKQDKKSHQKEKIASKKKIFKMLGASSRFNQQDLEEDEDDIYISKVDVYVSDDSDEEGENQSSSNSSNIDSMRSSVLSFFNDSSDTEIFAIPGCTKKKADIIMLHRPYRHWRHLVEVLKREKNVSPEMLNKAKSVLQKRSSVNQLMKRCEFISSDIQNTVSALVMGDETDAAISRQPELLNPEMQLKGYQMIGLNWLSLMHQHGLNGVLADEMGLGKTVQAIAYLAHIMETVNPQDLSLIVVPSSTLDNWARELDVWCPSLGVLIYHGSQEERRGMRMSIINDQVEDEIRVILTTYNMVYSCTEDRVLFKKMKLHTVIFDEAHMLKNMNSLRFENLMKIKADCRLLLTGTPLQNNLVELMSILVFVMPQLFEGRKEDLKQVFAMFPKSSDREKGQYESKRIEQAKRIMKPFFLRRLKVDVLKDLPEKREEVLKVPMFPDQRCLYDRIVTLLSNKAKQMKEKLDNLNLTELDELTDLNGSSGSAGLGGGGGKEESKKGDADSSANMLMTLRRIANHPLLHRQHYNHDKIRVLAKQLKKTSHRESILEYIIEDFCIMSDYEIHQTCAIYPSISQYRLPDSAVLASGKFEKLDQLLPDMKERGDRVLIFSQFVIVLNIVEEYMKIRGHRFLRLDGSTPVTERQEMIDEYNENPEIFIFLLSTRAGGLGINLTSANTVILHDIDFNPYNDKQAEDRCHRLGQTRPVNILRFISEDSIEEGIRGIALSKLDLEREVTENKDEKQKKSDVVTLLKAALGLMK